MFEQKISNALYILKKYGTIPLGFFGSLVGAAIGTFIFAWASGQPLDSYMDLIQQYFTIFLLLIILIFLLLLSFSVRRRISFRLDEIETVFHAQFGSKGTTEYGERVLHFHSEKLLLCGEIAGRILPKWINETEEQYNGVDIILDSGTTIAPLFLNLKRNGFGESKSFSKETCHIYTNSMSGSDAFCMETKQHRYPVTDKQLHLFGGTPLRQYRAVTGSETTDSLRRLKQSAEKENRYVIGIITGNWILGGPDFHKLVIAAKGTGHGEFKQMVLETAHKILIVSPLGKILKLGDVDSLNKLLRVKSEPEKYDPVTWSESEKERVHLLTSVRNSTRWLHPHSDTLVANKAGTENYCQVNHIEFNPKGGTDQQIEQEVPHQYMHRLKEQLFYVR